MRLNRYIEHTLLKPEARPDEIVQCCREGDRYGFAAVCVNPVFVSLARHHLRNSPVKVATVVGFPLGASSPFIKAMETKQAIEDGAEEIDMVMALGFFKAREFKKVEADITEVVRQAFGLPVKVILETGLWSPEDTAKACRLASGCGAAYVKTSTGFGLRAASVEDVRIMMENIDPGCRIKASGGIRTSALARDLIAAGASRLGTSSGIKIVEEDHE